MKSSLLVKRDWLMSRKAEAVTTQGQLLLEREINQVNRDLEGFVSLAGVQQIKNSVLVRAKAEFLQNQARRMARAGNLQLSRSLANEALEIISLLGETK